MPTTDTTPTPAPADPRTRSCFNQSQLDDIDLAESVHRAACQNTEAMIEQEITTVYLDGFEAALAEARSRSSDSNQDGEKSKQATAAANRAAALLHTSLQKIQSCAKQKHKMLAEDGDPTTDFPTDGYLIGRRLNASRTILLQSADTLIGRAKTDSLPGFKTPEKILAVENLRKAYNANESDQQESTLEKELAKLTRDDLIHLINTRRSAIQHAADALWPSSDEANRPIRKTFCIPLTRSLGL